MVIDKIQYAIKNNMLVRALCKPYKDFMLEKRHNAYIHSKDAAYLRTLKNKHQGRRCFIIGNGPSLDREDLERLKDEITFAANKIYEIFAQTSWRPVYYLAVDPNFISHNLEQLDDYQLNEMFLAAPCLFREIEPEGRKTTIFEYSKFAVNKWNDRTAYISQDISSGLSIGYTVTFTAIQMAIYMGINEIYLLGVDFNYSKVRDQYGRIHKKNGIKDYFSNETSIYSVLNYESAKYAYLTAAQYGAANGVRIYNATRGGCLELFERKDFDMLFD